MELKYQFFGGLIVTWQTDINIIYGNYNNTHYIRYETKCMWCSTRIEIGPFTILLYMHDIASVSTVLSSVFFANGTTLFCR